jgi:hypothetical protein
MLATVKEVAPSCCPPAPLAAPALHLAKCGTTVNSATTSAATSAATSVATSVATSGAAVRELTILDQIGATLSFGCAAHCIALPFVITFLPLLGLGFVAGSTFETVMILLTLTLATTSFCWGMKVHGQSKTFIFLLAAIVFFVIGLSEVGHGFFSHAGAGHDLHHHDGSTSMSHWIFMGIGGFALAFGHFLNHRLCASCKDCSHH